MDLSGFSSFKTANKRKAASIKGQTFEDLKFRRAEGKKSGKLISQFTVSTARFESLGLASMGLRPFVNKATNEVALAVLSDEDAQLMKKTTKGEKGKKFKSDVVEAALNASGLIDSKAINTNQYLGLKLIATDVTVDGFKCSQVFQIVKGAKITPQPSVDAQPVAEQATAPAPTAKVWD